MLLAPLEYETAAAYGLKFLEIQFRARGVPLGWVAKKFVGSRERGKPNSGCVREVRALRVETRLR